MTKEANFKKAVRRHAVETGQAYTQARHELEDADTQWRHEPAPERLLAHLQEHYGGRAVVAAAKISVHRHDVFRIERSSGEPWVARVFPPARPGVGAEGDAEVLRFLDRHDFPAERLATEDPVSGFESSTVLVTRFIAGEHFPNHADRPLLGELLGRLHALDLDQSISRAGGANGLDPRYEGTPNQDLQAALALLDAVDTKIPAPERDRFEQLRGQVLGADAAMGLPEALVHGNIFGSPLHVLIAHKGPVAINWMSAGRGPRLIDFAELILGTPKEDVEATVGAYSRHVELTDEELDRLEAVMWIKPLFIASLVYHRNITYGRDGNYLWFIEPSEKFSTAAAAARAALGR